ncbi:dynamin-A-like isoform X2 [Hylaeus volcanicus]|uniref:dynamin-A-like isoform X2 n=1 Tax=Hylaeus volcanicus TaxID=313075 RepID=UPI0023B80C7C|nr:dynamin-A-like isoform X2 [Hylaeus volcanicus]
MDSVLHIINQLQDLTVSIQVNTSNSLKLDLPQIVVVGSQSVGKSSILECLVGKSFLPKGTGMVTRRPLILQLKNTTTVLNAYKKKIITACDIPYLKYLKLIDEDRLFLELKENQFFLLDEASVINFSMDIAQKECGCFLHEPDKIYVDFDLIREEIISETERLLGRTNSISPKPILLRIYSPRIADITLIDLPGIIKIPLLHQPGDIEVQILNLMKTYISHENSFILAISAANVDIANSDALKLAREVDPSGERTLGIITKCDLMDNQTNALDILSGERYPLKRGYIGVVCPSERSMIKKDGIASIIKEEKFFFSKNTAYSSIQHRCGIGFLMESLNKMFLTHIEKKVPQLKIQLLTLINDLEAQKKELGEEISSDKSNDGSLLLQYLYKYSCDFQNSIDGTITYNITHSELVGGARLRYIFHECFTKSLFNYDSLCQLKDDEIRTVIRIAAGPKSPLFIPDAAFEILVRKQVERFKAPALQCADYVYEELRHIIATCSVATKQHFDLLHAHILKVVYELLERRLGPTTNMISTLIDMESAYINTNHPDFCRAHECIVKLHTSPTSLGFNPLHPAIPHINIKVKAVQTPGENDLALQTLCVDKTTQNLSLGRIPTLLRLPPLTSDGEKAELDKMKLLIQAYVNIVKMLSSALELLTETFTKSIEIE